MFEKIKKLLSEQLSVDEQKITMQSVITKDLGADSLDIVELLFKVEEEYGIVIEDDEAMSMKTVSDIVEFLDKKGVK